MSRAGTSRVRVPVPLDVRRAVAAVADGKREVARAQLGVGIATYDDLVLPGGYVTTKMLAYVRGRLRGLAVPKSTYLDGMEHIRGSRDCCMKGNGAFRCDRCRSRDVHMQGCYGGYLLWCEDCGWEGP